MYIITRLDTISQVMGVFTFLFVVLSVILLICFFYNKYQDEPKFAKILKKYLYLSCPIAILFLILALAIPNTKQAIAIYTVPKIVNNESIQELPKNTADFVNEQLKLWVKELKEKRKIK
jgi:hypothetical protein